MDTREPLPVDPNSTALRADELTSVYNDPRYNGMNRKQRRHAQAHEARELRRQQKRRD